MEDLASWDAGQWLGMTGLAAIILLVAWLERKPPTWHLGLAASFLLFGATHVLFPEKTAALWMTLALIVVIGIAAKLKYRYLGFNLVAGDIIYLVASNTRALLADYRRLAVTAISAMIAVLGAGCLVAMILDEPITPLPERLGWFAAAVSIYFVALWMSGGSDRFNLGVLTHDRAHLSAFVASCFNVGLSRRPAFIDIDQESSPLLPPMPATRAAGEKPPHIILILHESTFDPRCLNLPIDTSFERFFAPQGALSGTLHVDVFGGGTIQTEFSVLTGLSSLSFGNDSGFVFHRMPGRIRHSLPSFLSGIGYDISLVSCSGPKLLNCGRFYKSIGLDEVSYAEILPAPFDAKRWHREHHDEQLYDLALDVLANRRGDKPLFLPIMTMMNHGGHGNPILATGRHAAARQAAIASTGNSDYGEYVVRLAETVNAYDAFRKSLDETLDGQPAIIVRFGDHQPSLTAPLSGLKPSDPALHKTFYAIEAVNCTLPQDLVAPRVLDVAYLSTLALLAARIPLDRVFATRAALLKDDPAAYFDIKSTTKRRFHRALVEAGMVNLA